MPPVRPALSFAGAVLLLGLSACESRPEASATPIRAEGVLEQAPVEARPVPSAPVPVEVPSLAPLVDRLLPTVVSVEVDPKLASGAANDEGPGAEGDDRSMR